jgi:hypothetical protein
LLLGLAQQDQVPVPLHREEGRFQEQIFQPELTSPLQQEMH